MSGPQILCFGEVLWDCLPDGRFLGGAPINVAYHLKKLGCRPIPVTAVGPDDLGREILQHLEHWGVDTRFVGWVPEKPTGTVRVRLENPDQPAYEITPDVAWDAIPGPPELFEAAHGADALVFGSLAQRSANNRALLSQLLQRVPGAKIFDVNLRPPFVDEARVMELARQSELIKLNERELSDLLHEPVTAGTLPEKARRFAEVTGCRQICVTAGRRGAGWLRNDAWTWMDAQPVEAKDAVGAGDAFLAVLVAERLRSPESSRADILHRACRLAEFVAQSDGATPEYGT